MPGRLVDTVNKSDATGRSMMIIAGKKPGGDTRASVPDRCPSG
jgi:hypothetical protein